MSSKEQDAAVAVFRREAIRMININMVNANMNEGFLRERAPSNSTSTRNDIPVMCSGCKGFFSPTYKSRHFEKCTSKKSNLMLPMIASESIETCENFSDEFKELLNTLLLDDVANYLKTDQIILMLGYRSFGAIKRRTDKKIETKKTVRSRMRLLARLYLAFCDEYSNQSEVRLGQMLENEKKIPIKVNFFYVFSCL